MDTRAKGKIGENIACRFLENGGFMILERNYQKKWGEIDIVAEKSNKLHFFEVKSITVESLAILDETYRPEENVHGLKIRNIRRMVETYLEEKGKGVSQKFSFHVICVFKDIKTRRARIRWIRDLIL